MFKKILIANRGEIACRIIKTAKRLGIQSIALYSEADRDSLAVVQADEAYYLGESEAQKSYLNIEKILQIAKAAGAEAIHPGYGFLSENPEFARACEDAGIVFIGPSAEAIEAMGSKQLSKQSLESTTVPLTPGYHGKDQQDQQLLAEAKRIGFPVLLKAAAGGGGKGMRAVEAESEFAEALAAARRESMASFNDSTMILEKLVQGARHVEVQILADSFGTVISVLERDCSVQRRHQKMIEEAPAPALSEALRQQLAAAAIAVAQKINYRSAGTVEFLVAGEAFYFMEMNTRLQVEHPVTEMITGLDLVEWQLRIAAGEALNPELATIQAKGHAIECRICAEDPSQGFIPSIGTLEWLQVPTGEGIRLDTGVAKGSQISRYYDPMIAKLITWGENREQALARMQKALAALQIAGLKTNIPYLQAILQNPRFQAAKLSTSILQEETIQQQLADPQQLLFAAAAYDYLKAQAQAGLDRASFGFQLQGPRQWSESYRLDKAIIKVNIKSLGLNRLELEIQGQRFLLQATVQKDCLILDDGQQSWHIFVKELGEQLYCFSEFGTASLQRFRLTASQEKPSSGLAAPMPATVVAVYKKIGETVKAGERLLVLEAMKMEHSIQAPYDGELTALFCAVGSQVKEGMELATIKAFESA